jgi:hypothetical protein
MQGVRKERRPADRKARPAASQVQTAGPAVPTEVRPAAKARRTAARTGNRLESRGSSTNRIQPLEEARTAQLLQPEVARCKPAAQQEPLVQQVDSTHMARDSTQADSMQADSSTADSSKGTAERL